MQLIDCWFQSVNLNDYQRRYPEANVIYQLGKAVEWLKAHPYDMHSIEGDKSFDLFFKRWLRRSSALWQRHERLIDMIEETVIAYLREVKTCLTKSSTKYIHGKAA